jgi:nucleotide-binding universal stress UspA family protein
MEPFKSIVVDIDASASAHPALKRAARLAQACGASLTIVDVESLPRIARHALSAPLEEEFISRRREQLVKVAREINGLTPHWKLLSGRRATALVREVLRSGHDLLVRSHVRDLAAYGPKGYGAIDVDLLRQCPCPVLLSGAGELAVKPRVCGAVNTATDDASEHALNIKIVEMTLMLARLIDGNATLLHVWAPLAEATVRTHASDDAFASYIEATRRVTEAELAQLVAPFAQALPKHQIFMRRGQPEEEIPKFVVSEGIDLLVMGTMGRSGIPGLVIGNTADEVLRRVVCSILAIKPEGFVSPVSG